MKFFQNNKSVLYGHYIFNPLHTHFENQVYFILMSGKQAIVKIVLFPFISQYWVAWQVVILLC